MFYYHYSIKRTNLRHDNSKIMFTAAKLQLFFDICKKKMKKVIFFTNQPTNRLSKSDKLSHEKSKQPSPYFFRTTYLPSRTEADSKTKNAFFLLFPCTIQFFFVTLQPFS